MKGSRLYIAVHVLARWVALICNLVLMTVLTVFLAELYEGHAGRHAFWKTAAISGVVLLVRFCMHLLSAKMSFLCVKAMKKDLRARIYTKLLRLGAAYKEHLPTARILQDAVEGVDQLENYYGTLLPDFFYGILATITLFGYLMTIHFTTAVCLLLGVALIPVAIVSAQTFARKAYGKYWDKYTEVGRTFLENLQGLTTLKIYRADQKKQDEMNRANEALRMEGMKVAFLRLDSITVMDFIACGGTAVGAILAISGFITGRLVFDGCLHILVLAAEFFLPMRTVGEHLYHAMKGHAAGEKIRHLLDLPERTESGVAFPAPCTLSCKDLHFSYDGQREILRGVQMEFPVGSLTAIVGESGCGKSTVAHILMDRHPGYTGRVLAGNISISEISEASLLKNVTYVGHKTHFFHGSVAENLRLAKPSATERELWQVLDLVHIGDALRRRQGLDTVMEEHDLHLSGGQLQRISLARAILHDSSVYIFDEATSNMDGESEHYAMEAIYSLAREKSVILISHRLPNVMKANRIYVMEKGLVAEWGTHKELIEQDGVYATLWHTQHRVECSLEGGTDL